MTIQTIRYQIWHWARDRGAQITTSQVMEQFTLKMAAASRHLGELVGGKHLTRTRLGGQGNRYGYEAAVDNPPQETMGNPTLMPTVMREPDTSVVEVRQSWLEVSAINDIVQVHHIAAARAMECAPLIGMRS